MSIKEIMTVLGMDKETYDTAIPNEFFNRLCENGLPVEDRRNYVWLYDEQNRIFGRPFNYIAAYAKHLLKQEEDLLEGISAETFYDKWSAGKEGYTNLGSFHTALMELFRLADTENKIKLIRAYPEFFRN